MREGIGRARIAALGLTIAAAALTTLATQVADVGSPVRKALLLCAAVSVGLAPVARSQLATGSIMEWTRARSVSEALKSDLYTFLAGTGPYRGADRSRQLEARTQQVLVDAGDLLRFTAGLQPVSRALPTVQDVDSYVAERLDRQLRWYADRAADLQTSLNRVRYAVLTLTVIGVMLAAAGAALDVTAVAAWVAVVTTVTAAVAAYAAGSRYEYQLVEYLRTAAQLDHLRSGWAAGVHDQASGDAFVANCEHVISVQNEAWMAKWTGGNDVAPTDHGGA